MENVKDALAWWVTNQAVYPHLSRMGLDYLSIPGTYYVLPASILDLMTVFSYVC